MLYKTPVRCKLEGNGYIINQVLEKWLFVLHYYQVIEYPGVIFSNYGDITLIIEKAHRISGCLNNNNIYVDPFVPLK